MQRGCIMCWGSATKRSLRVAFVSGSSPTWFNGSIRNNFIISSGVISLIKYVTKSLS
ncbi:hypothetical protein MtrunA17_Chr4g0019451 [Medicago truncatula]|uniref:Uncharacterized protein n=1 Tax=Medicago truncatula TaxID=3880 RepID=A0A396I2S0_MEDTR|nr:hypothetical protein MtrunA17_Chr4g0019451 [Medicago truncatula]